MKLDRKPMTFYHEELLDTFGKTYEIPTKLLINTFCHLKILTDQPKDQNSLINSIKKHGSCAFWSFRNILCRLDCHIPQLACSNEMYTYIWISKTTGQVCKKSSAIYLDEDICFEDGLIEKPSNVSCSIEINIKDP